MKPLRLQFINYVNFVIAAHPKNCALVFSYH